MFAKFKIPKPVFYISSVATVMGVVCVIKENVGGPRYRKYVLANDKVIIITGANTGIGKETAMELARRGGKIYMACRDLKRCEEARKDIVVDSQNKYIYCRKCDLSSLESIRQFVETFNKEQNRLDILINNAGVMNTPERMKTKEGFELQLGVNHMGHFLLTNLLLNKLKESAPSRIINVSSVAHKRGQINTNDLNSDKEYNGMQAYSQSKLANILFTKELARRLKGTGVTVNAVNPGTSVQTDITRHMSISKSWFTKTVLGSLMWPFVKSPMQGAQTSIFAALEPQLEKVSGRYFSDSTLAQISEAAKDESLAKWLWSVSEKWTRLAS